MAKATAGKDTKVPQPATGLRHFVATLFATLLKGVCWAVPIGVVAKINLDASVHLSTGWAAAGAVMAALGAGSVYLALHGNSAKTRTLFAVLGVVFLIGNFSNALGNIAEQSDASRDTKTAAKETVATLREQVSQVSQDRKAVAAVAGSATPAAIEAEIAAAKAADAPRWKATEQCNPDKITAGPSRTFCANLAQLEAKKAAATRRDQLDARKQQLEEELQGKPAPDSVDSFVDAVAEPIALAGYHVDAKQRRLIGVLRNWLRAFILEVLGEFGPSILLALLDMVLKPSQAAPKPVKSRGAAVAIAKGEAPAQPDAASEAKAGRCRRLPQRLGPLAGGHPGSGCGDRRVHDVLGRVAGGIREASQRLLHRDGIPLLTPALEGQPALRLHFRVDDHDPAVAAGLERRHLGLAEAIHPDDDLLAGFDPLPALTLGGDERALHVVDGIDRAAMSGDLRHLLPGAVDHFGDAPSTTSEPSNMSSYSSRSVSNARICWIRRDHCWSHGRGRPSASFQAGSCSAVPGRDLPSVTASVSSMIRYTLFSGCASVSPSELTWTP